MPSSDAASGPPRDTDTAAVLEAYGAAMLAIQLFEHHLAHLWLWHNQGAQSRATARNMEKMLRRAVHVSHSASASELRRGLEGHLDDEFLDEVGRAISWRNYLAHRVLRERLRSQPMPHFVAGTLEELGELREWFFQLAARLEGLLEAHAASVAEEAAGVSEEVKAAFLEVGWRVWRGDHPDDPPRRHPLP